MHFAAPLWLWLLLPALVWVGVRWMLGQREFLRRWRLFAGPRVSDRDLARFLAGKRRQWLWLAGALLALVVALARPLGGLSAEAARRQGVNVLIAVDGSASMLVEDAPAAANRFAAAQQGVASLVKNFQGDRAGLLIFGGQATLVSPMTFDTVSLELISRGLDPELVGKGGTSLADVIKQAAAFYHDRPAYKSRVLILFSDGEETEGDAVVAAQEAHRREGLDIFTVGVGTVAGGPIPQMERDEQRAWVRVGTVHDQSGEEVRSHQDPKLLALVAQVGGGTYTDLAAVKGDLGAWYQQQMKPRAAPLEEAELKDYREWFQVPLAVALGLVVAGLLWIPGAGHVAAVRGPVAPSGSAGVIPIFVLLVLACGGSLPKARGATRDLQRMLDSGQAQVAFEQLQQARLMAANDPIALYNYAVGAYAVGKFDVAAGTFEKLAGDFDPETANRALFQLGNSLYRWGETMHPANPEGALALWLKAAAALAKSRGPKAESNYKLVHADILSLLQDLAGAREGAGDEAARLAPERGIPAWRDAVGFIERAIQLAPGEAETAALDQARARVLGKIFTTYLRLADDKVRLAELQHTMALEGAIGLLKEALENYDQALALRPADAAAKAGLDHALTELEPWQVALADQWAQQGDQARGLSLDDAIGYWQKAAGRYGEVLQKNPGNQAALAGKERMQHSLHDGHEELGDRRQEEAADTALSPEDRDTKLEDGLEHYRIALAWEPGNARTKDKWLQLGLKLAGMFMLRGQKELAAGRELSTSEKPGAAIPWLERAVQSFTQTLTFDPKNEPGAQGKLEAEELLRRLRNQESRKVQAHSKEIKNAQEIKNLGDLALKLIDYNTDHAASRKQQNYTLPENRPVKDW